MSASRFSTSGSVLLKNDGTGKGTGIVKLSPPGVVWQVDLVSVSTNQTTSTIINEAQAEVFIDQLYVGGSVSGSTGDSSSDVHYVDKPQTLSVVWTIGDIGATATARVAGWAYSSWSELSP